MLKFKCDLCEAECELTMNICDLEDQIPHRCPVSDISARFTEIISTDVEGPKNACCDNPKLSFGLANGSWADLFQLPENDA
jgi:hypothetical protein